VLFLNTFGFLLSSVVLPILLMSLLGVWLQKRTPLDFPTLTKVQVNLLAPCFMLVKLSDSSLSWADMGLVAVALLGSQIVLGVPIWAALKARGTNMKSASVVLLASVVFNSGNYGIPLADRAFPGRGAAPQALIVVISNTTVWLMGYLLMGGPRVAESGMRSTSSCALHLPWPRSLPWF
jgi:predicted permease